MLALPSAIVMLAFVLGAVAWRGGSNGLDAHVTVRQVSDPARVGATTDAEVDVQNAGATEIRPRFSVTWLPYPYYWNVVSGPLVLEPGDRATYHIAAPRAEAAPPDGQPFRIKLNDASSIVYALSPSIDVPAPTLAVVNPNFQLWTQRDLSTGLLSPFGWQIYQRIHAPNAGSITNSDVYGIHATRFQVAGHGAPESGGWSHTGLIQTVPFPSGVMTFSVLSNAPYKSEPGGWPLTAFGVEVTDGSRDLLWFLFQPTGRGDLDYALPTGQHIHVYDVPAGRWQDVSIDLGASYDALHRARPSRVTIKLFMGVADRQPDDITGYVARVSSRSSRNQ